MKPGRWQHRESLHEPEARARADHPVVEKLPPGPAHGQRIYFVIDQVLRAVWLLEYAAPRQPA